VDPMHGDQVQVPSALNRLHQHVDAVTHVDVIHGFRLFGVWELIAGVWVIVRVDEFSQHVQAM